LRGLHELIHPAVDELSNVSCRTIKHLCERTRDGVAQTLVFRCVACLMVSEFQRCRPVACPLVTVSAALRVDTSFQFVDTSFQKSIRVFNLRIRIAYCILANYVLRYGTMAGLVGIWACKVWARQGWVKGAGRVRQTLCAVLRGGPRGAGP
jgi:hypothetical protein